MKQNTYNIEDRRSFTDTLRTIARSNIVADPQRTLIILHESSDEQSVYEEDLKSLTQNFPGIHTVGITMIAPLVGWMKLPTGAILSILSFEKSSFSIFRYDCSQISPEEAARAFSKEVLNIPDAKGVLLMTSDSALDPDRFLKALLPGADKIPFFGTQAGSHVSGEDRSQVFLDGKAYHNSVLAVVFRGKDLHIRTSYSFGWRPLGREMTITDVAHGHLVRKIDHEDVLDIYYNYLHITPDKNFYPNVCAFPLVIQAGDRITSRVPIHYEEDGIYFTTTMNVGDQVSLSYSKENYLMDETVRMSNELLAFQPEAMYCSVCVNRRIFMGNESADREIDYARYACPSLIFGYGFGEILKQNGNGGFLNSTFVSAAFREGPSSGSPDRKAPLIPPREKTDFIPLSERLVSFLEATTRELRGTISDLRVLASHDRMTSIFNRMTVENLLNARISEAEEDGTCLSVLLFDIDSFKAVNDSYGHAVGDEVLKKVSEMVAADIPEEVLFGRWGGDEFLCVFPGWDSARAARKAEELRGRIAEAGFDPVRRITVSMGIAQYERSRDPDRIIVEADRALYHSKHNGRNLVTVYTDDYEGEMESIG